MPCSGCTLQLTATNAQWDLAATAKAGSRRRVTVSQCTHVEFLNVECTFLAERNAPLRICLKELHHCEFGNRAGTAGLFGGINTQQYQHGRQIRQKGLY